MNSEERRAHKRKRVIFGAQATMDGQLTKLDCVVRNFSEVGANIDIANNLALPDDINLTIGRKKRSYRARVVWSKEKTAGVMFQSHAPSVSPTDELELRLRKSERQTRRLKSRIKQLMEG